MRRPKSIIHQELTWMQARLQNRVGAEDVDADTRDTMKAILLLIEYVEATEDDNLSYRMGQR